MKLLAMTLASLSLLASASAQADSTKARADVRHLAATPIGMQVTFRSEVTGVEDRRLFFKVEAFDQKEKIGEGHP